MKKVLVALIAVIALSGCAASVNSSNAPTYGASHGNFYGTVHKAATGPVQPSSRPLFQSHGGEW